MASYVSTATLKATLGITASTWDTDINSACESASRAVEQECSRVFASGAATRYYTPSDSYCLPLDDITTVTSVTVDTAGNNTFSTTWTSGTDFDLTPYNAAADGWPYTGLELRQQSGAVMPSYTRSIKVIGTFGWPAVPAPVTQAVSILAARLFKRMREAPLGVYGFGLDGSTVRISSTDPDICALLEPYSRRTPLL